MRFYALSREANMKYTSDLWKIVQEKISSVNCSIYCFHVLLMIAIVFLKFIFNNKLENAYRKAILQPSSSVLHNKINK